MVLVCHEHRFIYMKTKKTASTSIESYFARYCSENPEQAVLEFGPEDINPKGIVGARGSRHAKNARWHGHMSAIDAARQLGPRKWFSYFRFTSIRNPFSKCLSMFFFRNRGDERLPDMAFEEVRKEFHAWMAADNLVRDRYVYRIGGIVMAQDYIRYERLTEDMVRICDRMGLQYDSDFLPRFKTDGVKPDRHFSEYYDKATEALVNQRFGWEMRRFGYSIDDPA